MRNYTRNIGISLAVLGLVFASAGIASALYITSVNGDWSNPNPAAGITISPDKNNVSWGTAAPNYSEFPSSYDFEARETPFDALTDGSKFMLGLFRHNNFTIWYEPDKFLQTVSLDVELTIDGLSSPVKATFDFTHNETLNKDADGNISPVNDIVTLVEPQLDAVDFWVLDHHYVFTLLGFFQDGQKPNVFSTVENRINEAILYGQIIERPVPEPGTILLLGIGLAGMGFVARRRKK